MATGEIDDKKIIAEVTPGGGKSTLPIIVASELIIRQKVDRVCWVVPRDALRSQGERSFEDPFFREMFRHRLSIRSASNEQDPCRGTKGFVTTYQAVAAGGHNMIREFERNRYAIILDEPHHVELDGEWHKALSPLMERAKYQMLMSGTMARGNKKQIAFVPYQETRAGYRLDYHAPGIQRIIYTRADALSERAILPIHFHLSDASATWRDDLGNEQFVSSLAGANKKNAGAAVFTALSTEFADDLLKNCVSHWLDWRTRNPRSKLLVVAAGIESAKKYTKDLNALGLNVEIATSHETEAAQAAILRYKRGQIDVLVTIAMAYEGLDVPEVTHIAALTHIRSAPWIEQMVARAVRVDRLAGPYESQKAFVFAPDDVLFRQVVKQIQSEQKPFIKSTGGDDDPFEKKKKPGNGQMGLFGGPQNRFGITPIGSEIQGARELRIDSKVTPLPSIPVTYIKTQSELEKDLREKIDKHVRRFSFVNGMKPHSINSRIMREFAKPRADMTLPELEKAWAHIQHVYSLANTAAVEKKLARRARAEKDNEWHGPIYVPTYGGR